MRVCVFGAGAVGGYLAAMLARAGQADISVVARGAHAEAMRTRGLRLLDGGDDFTVTPFAVADNAAALPLQDIVFVTLKTTSQPDAADAIAQLIAPGGHAVFVNNGIPWWWAYRGDVAGKAQTSCVDPAGRLWRALGPGRVLGCVVYSYNLLEDPGVVRHVSNNKWLLGEPDGSDGTRLARTVDLLQAAGIVAARSADLRRDVWTKLLRNASLNTLCALTRLSIGELAREDGLRVIHEALIGEVSQVAAACGWDISPELPMARQALTAGGALDGRQVADARPSMLHDVVAGRPLEVESILGQVQVFARETSTPCPTIDTLVPLLRGLDAALRGAAG